MGVWIETLDTMEINLSLPVTPFVGVWIETAEEPCLLRDSAVTPFVGVWIETLTSCPFLTTLGSHTLRGCVD